MGFGANQGFDFIITSAEQATTLQASQNGQGVFKSISEISGNSPLTPSQNHSLIFVMDSVMKSFQKEVHRLPGTALSTALGPNGCLLTRASYTWRLLSSVCNAQKADKHASLSQIPSPLTFTSRWDLHYIIQPGLEPTLWSKGELNL